MHGDPHWNKDKIASEPDSVTGHPDTGTSVWPWYHHVKPPYSDEYGNLKHPADKIPRKGHEQ